MNNNQSPERVERRDYRKFFTFPETAAFMAELLHPKPGQFILEPSAGNGSLVRAVKLKCHDSIVCAIELYEEWGQALKECADLVVIRDFLLFESIPKFSSCIGNPPFGNGIDLQAHFDKMRSHVKQGGKMVILLPDAFNVPFEHRSYPLENWSTNKDGSITPIKIVEFNNQ